MRSKRQASPGPRGGRETPTPDAKPAAALPEAAVHTLDRLDQIKVLADPLRVRLLEAFCEESTTKQVAERLGEKPTKLYHHVEALERVGLLRPTRTRQNRGTVEKYYQAVARTFQADPRVFCGAAAGPSGPEGETAQGMISTIFDSTRDEVRRLLAAGITQEAIDELGMISYLEVRASAKALRRLRRRLRDLLQSLATPEEGEETERKRYRLTLAFYPLPDRGGAAPSERKPRTRTQA